MKIIATVQHNLPDANQYVDSVVGEAWPVVLSISSAMIGLALTAAILKSLRG